MSAKRVYFTPQEHTRAALALIRRLGVYGAKATPIMNHLVAEEIKRLLERGLVTRDDLALSAERIAGGKDWDAEDWEETG